MAHEDNYWERRARFGRFSRRRFIGSGLSLGAGAAALAAVGCGDDDDADEPGTSTESGATPGATTAGAATATPAVQATKGGIGRFISANNTWDTFDADRTRFGPMTLLLGLTHHGVVGWDNYAESKIGGHFAESWEQPDKTTYVFKVRPGLNWHNKAPLNGRAAKAADIVYHVLRNKEAKTLNGQKDANFYREGLFQNIAKAEAVDDTTAKITTNKPYPFLLNLFAANWTKVQARETVDSFEEELKTLNPDHIAGTGSFTLTKFEAAGNFSLRRFDKTTRQSLFDGLDYVALWTDAAAQQAAFEQKQVDAFSPSSQTVAEDIKKRLQGKIYDKKIFFGAPTFGTYYGGTAPWKDQNLIGAIFRVLDRRGSIQSLEGGNGVLAGPGCPPGWAPFSLTEKELITFPGYIEDRQKDYAEGKKMWEAGGGPALGEITIDIPDIFEGSKSGAAALYTNHLKSILGNDFKAKLEPYATITSKIVAQKYGNGTNNIWFGWGNGPQDPEPSTDISARWDSTIPAYKQYDVAMPNMDSLIAKINDEFDVKKRIELNQEVSRELLRAWGGGHLTQYQGIANILYWNYYKIGESTHFNKFPNIWSEHWFDQKDPTWSGRPS